jgi:hypothetical protein
MAVRIDVAQMKMAGDSRRRCIDRVHRWHRIILLFAGTEMVDTGFLPEAGEARLGLARVVPIGEWHGFLVLLKA